MKQKLLLVCVSYMLLLCIFNASTVEAATRLEITSGVAGNGLYAVNVNGTTSLGQTSVTMTVQKSVYQGGIDRSNIASRVFYIDEGTSASDGTFQFQYPMSDDSAATEYTVVVYAGSDKATGTYFYASKAGRNAVVAAINEAQDRQAVMNIINDQTNQKILSSIGLEISTYNNLEETRKADVCDIFIQERSKGLFNESTLQTAFNASITVERINKARTTSEIKGILEERGLSLGIQTAQGSDYAKIVAGGKGQELYEYILLPNGNKYPASQEVINKYNEKKVLLLQIIRIETALREVNAADYGSMESILLRYNDIFLINFNGDYTKVENLDRPLVYKALVGKGFTQPEKVKESFDLKVSELIKTKGKGSGSGGGGSEKKSTSVTVVVPPVIEPQPQKVTFNDLKNVPWAKEAIEELAEQKIISGVDASSFAPDEYVTREQFAKILIGAFGLVDENAKTTFEDSVQDEWYYKYVASAQKLNIINGIDGKHFGIGQNITRQEMAVMAYRVAEKVGLKLDSGSGEAFEDDSSIEAFAKVPVYALRKAKIINGLEDNNFTPQGYSTRAQAAVIIYKLITMGK